MAGHRHGEQVGAVHVDGKELAEAVNGVVGGLEVLGEAGRGHEVVNLAVAGKDLVDAGFHTVRV